MPFPPRGLLALKGTFERRVWNGQTPPNGVKIGVFPQGVKRLAAKNPGI